jgi:hypothetical protein
MKKLLHTFTVLFVAISFGQTPIYQFNFDGNLNNSGTGSFTNFTTGGTGTLSYVANRSGQSNSAVYIPKTVVFPNSGSVNAPDLPSGNNSRTLSFWVKFIGDNDSKNYAVVGWGSSINNQAFGFWRNGVQNSYYTWGSGNDYNVPQTANQIQASNSGWVHIAMTHDGVNMKIYYNGVIQGTYPRTLATFGPSYLVLNRLVNSTASNSDDIILDDLKIYDTELSATQISDIYNQTTTSAPTISNISSSLIHEGANISYTVNAGGASTTTTVLYGQTASANELAATGTTATGTTNTACTATTQYNLSAAAAGTTMYYRIQATNSVGTVFSPTLTYTQVAKPTYDLSSISNITTSSAQVNYTLNPNGANATSVVKYGTSIGSYPNTVTGFSALGFTPNFNGVSLSGLTPNTVYYFIVEGTNTYGVSQSAFGTFTTQGASPTLSAVSVSNIAQTTASVNFSLNSGGTSTTTVVNYGTSSSNLNNTVNGPTVNTNVATPYTINLTGLTANTTYYYNVVANGNGTAVSGVDSFTTLATPTIPNPVYNFEFNNNLQSQDGSVTLNDPIFGTTPFSYVSNGTVANGALRIDDARSQTTLPNLPLGNASRTVQIRIKYPSGVLGSEHFPFNYGTAQATQAFGFTQSATATKFVGWGGSTSDYSVAGVSFGTWYDYTLVYNGTSITIYRDGVSVGSQNVTLNTVGDTFRIGVSNSGIQKLQADIDYIRIFNQVLTAAQVSALVANPSLANNEVVENNLRFTIYPNPAQDILNIESENEVKSVEIYSIQGQKVLSVSSKVINISDLTSGLYLVQVTDIENITAAKKLIIK